MPSLIELRTTLHLRATVQPGKTVEVSCDELREGDTVDVFLVMPTRPATGSASIIDFLDTLPSGPRSFSTWEDSERRFQEERDSWDR